MRYLPNDFPSLIDLAKKLTEFPTFKDHGMRDCAQFLHGELARLGFEVKLDELNNVYAEKTFNEGKGTFLINTHFDTVPSTPK